MFKKVVLVMYKGNLLFCFKDDLVCIQGNEIIKCAKLYDCYITLRQKEYTQSCDYNIFPSDIYKRLKNV